MTGSAIERFVAAVGSRRTLFGVGLASLALAAAPSGGQDQEADAHRRRKRRRRTRRRRRRRNQGGGGGGPDGGPECFVCEEMSDGPNCRFTSIQDALNAARDGETIAVCAGTFKERLIIGPAIAPNITILGASLEETTLDADGEGSAITVQGGGFVTVQGLIITGGKANAGGGIYNLGSLTVTDSFVIDNESVGSTGGGGIFNMGTLTLSLTNVIHNDANDGYGGGILNAGGKVTLEANTQVEHNKAALGGGIFSAGGRVTLDTSIVIGNSPDNCAGNITCGA